MPQAVDEQPASNGASKISNQLLVSIQTLEAIREFSKDVVPLQGDGSNLHSWTCEIEEVLDDLIQSPKYFQSGKPSNLNPEHDKIARKLIYWTIPRELRCCLRDSKSAHDSYESLKVQFHKNVRTLHMATFVELLNVRAEINEPSCVTLLYNYMYSKYQELINSGFRVEEDTIFGVMFQMAIGRSTSIKLYNEISEFLDSRMLTNHSGVSSLEVSSVARSRLEILKQSESYEEESLPATPQAIYSTKNPNNSNEEQQQQQQPNSNVNGSEPYPVEEHANKPDEPPSSSKSRDKRPAVTPSPSESRIESSRNSTKNAKGDEPAPVSTPQPKPFAVAQPQPQPGQTLSSTQKQSSTDPKTQATPSSSSATLTVSQPSLTASQLSSKPPLTDQSKSPSKPSTNQTSNNDNDKKGSKSNSVIGVTSIFPATTTSSSTASHSDSRPSVFFPASFSSGTRPNSSTGSPSTTHSNNNNNNNNNKNKPPNSSGGWNEKPPSNTPSNFKF